MNTKVSKSNLHKVHSPCSIDQITCACDIFMMYRDCTLELNWIIKNLKYSIDLLSKFTLMQTSGHLQITLKRWRIWKSFPR